MTRTGKKTQAVATLKVAPARPREQGPAGVEAFKQIIPEFIATLDQLRSFVTIIAPLLAKEEKRTIVEKAPQLAPLLSLFKRVGVVNNDKDNSVIDAALRAVGQTGISWKQVGPGEFRLRANARVGKELDSAVRELSKAQKHQTHLYNSSLVSLTSAADIFFGNLLGAFYRAHPESAELNDRPLTYRMLSQFPDIQAAREFLLETKIDLILRGSLSEWFDHLREKQKLSMGYLPEQQDYVTEVFQRRNLFVHAGGKVNRIYLTNTSEKARGKRNVGEQLIIDQSYLMQAIDRVELVFTLIGAELWKKLAPGDEDRGATLVNASVEHLVRERWCLAEGLAQFGAAEKQLPETLRLMAQVNYWQTKKWRGQFALVEKEARAADFTAKSPEFRLAQLALLDDADAFFPAAREALRGGHIEPEDLRVWPLFREMRKDSRFDALVAGRAVARKRVGPTSPAVPSSKPKRRRALGGVVANDVQRELGRTIETPN